MKKTITLLMLVLCFLITSIPNFGQCDQEFYTDLSGPCATSVCGYDPYCCNVEWDNICAGEAASDPSCAYCWADCHDNDLDNYTNCDGDCDDFDDTIHPGAYDICGNGIDEDCDGSDNTSACDAAGYSNTSSICGVTVCSFDPFCCVTQWDNICASEATIVAECQFCWCNCYDNDVDGFTNCDGDCDDFDDAVYPGATEICNNIDDDCNGIIDDGFTVPYYRDLDGDGYGSPIFMVESCIPIVGYVLNNLDCDDTNFFVNPSIGETCSNEVDDNCDGFIDNSSGSCDVVGYADLAGPCGTSVCAYDDFCCNTAWDIICAGEAASDANCSYCVCGCYDNDMDGYTNCDGDCDDFNPAINPGEVEICSNELDDDCSNLVDDVSGSCDAMFYNDLAGPCATAICAFDNFCCNVAWDLQCAAEAAADINCSYCVCGCYDNDMDGYTNCDGDCNDFNDAINPGATEVCDEIDNNCDGNIDEGVQNTYYLDEDGDGFGTITSTTFACSLPPGYSTDASDCDDSNILINPLGTETCNGIDDDCSNGIDDGVQNTYYFDDDGDGYGDPGVTTLACTTPPGYVDNADDCDDTDAAINPDAEDICDNGIDENCDGFLDNTTTACDRLGYSDLSGPCATLICTFDSFCCSTEWDNVCAAEAMLYTECQYCWCGCYDNDLDGYTNCDGDCNDFNGFIYPGATEFCDSQDNDCDGSIDEGLTYSTYYMDDDGDGYGDPNVTTIACAQPFPYSANNLDCDDSNSAIRPFAPEVCNNIDDDCDGSIDEGVQNLYYADADGDGYGDPLVSVADCNQPIGYVTDNSDCDDGNDAINVTSLESCNGADDNCDGNVDEGLPTTTYFEDADGDGYGNPSSTIDSCSAVSGYVNNDEDCDDTDSDVNPDATETCNTIDDDCDGDTDEGVLITFYADTDSDGYGDASATVQDCSPPSGYVTDDTDCDDTDGNIFPGAQEFCGNGVDDDCDGDIDEVGLNIFFADADGDGYGDPSNQIDACIPPVGYVTDDTDCDDSDENVNPGMDEVCGNGTDDDCDGDTDEVLPLTYYADSDGDGYGDATQTLDACTQPLGYVSDDTDCDDADENVNPGVDEVCNNGLDDNCDGNTDDIPTFTFYADVDGDGYGDPSSFVVDCTLPSGYVTDDTDCDDADENVNPGATEVCGNGTDDDCDGDTDEVGMNTYFADTDGDGYGDASNSTMDCTQPLGYVSDDTDCDDADENVNPGVDEVCNNGLDDNCDGNTDDIPTFTFYADVDGDGYGDPSSFVVDCTLPSGYVTDDTDCDDADENVNPGATEVCGNGTDDDCDGDTDEVGMNTYFADADGDGYGDASNSTMDCTQPLGYVSDDTDCDDADENVNPGVDEVCNNALDDNCDGNIDDIPTFTFYADMDGDGYGDPSSFVVDCTLPSGYVTDDTDCDDADENVNPGATEVCGNGTDDDCDGDTDEVGMNTYFADTDGDGYGDASNSTMDCTQPAGYVTDDTDCDDADENVNPGATEVCGNGTDDDCDGDTDEVGMNTYFADTDGDGYGDASNTTMDCTQPTGYVTDDTDCDDADENVNPGATEVCGNGTDDDCDGNTDDVGMNTYYADIDGDGYGDASNTTMDCTQPTGYVTDDGDCDDGDANVNPGMDEICNNGVDDNCDGNTDDIPVATYYNDNDGDGYGDPLDAITACQQPDGYVTDNTDCDDNNEFVNPGAEDLCNNGSDDNCDGTIDETPVLEFYADTDGDGYGDPLMSLYDCTPPLGYVSNNEDCDDTNFDINPAATEVCNDMDDDCNESIDDGVTFTTYYADSDGDGYGDANTSISSCEPVAGYVTDNTDCDDNDNSSYPGGTEICDNVDNDCDGDADNGLEFITYFADEDGDGYGSAILGDFCSAPANSSVVGGDCNDNNASISPDASESCDEIDNNCDGNIDNDVVYVDYYDDNDGDGFGDLFLGNLCIAPIGGVTTPGDCDDSNEEINPDATEICNDTDDNCDELVDEGLEYADYYSDDDGDGYGDVLVGSFCAAPLNTSTMAGDCDDNNANINPGSVEFCNEVDDNCDEAIDNDVSYFDYYSDLDGDGYGADYLGNFCLPPADAVINSTDCDDTDAGVHPNAPEFCDNADNNCNGSIDEGLITFTYYADNDGDAVGGDLLGDFCSPPANSSLINGDCNDSDENVYPGADEVCNSEDDNCNEAVDEGVLNSYYEDADGDNYGDIGGLVLACSNPTGYVDNSNDCDDSDSSINPDAIEFCDGIDNDCNGAIDDNCIDSVEEINISWSVQLYPNPAHDQLNVVVSGATGMMDYTIHDAMGRLVIQSKLNGSHVVNLIDCSKLSQGSYSITVNNGTEQVIHKFVKL